MNTVALAMPFALIGALMCSIAAAPEKYYECIILFGIFVAICAKMFFDALRK